MQKNPLRSLGSCIDNFPFHQSCGINTRVFSWISCTSAKHAGSFDCLMTSLILITMDTGRVHCAWWQSCKFPNHRWIKKRKINQIKTCAEYQVTLPKPRLDLSVEYDRLFIFKGYDFGHLTYVWVLQSSSEWYIYLVICCAKKLFSLIWSGDFR